MNFRYGYTGREWDGETGQYYYRARYYDSGVGRFISEDPIGFAAGDTNIYRYVGNSSTDFVDPSGNLARLPIPNNRPAPPINRPIIRSRPPVNIPYDRSPIGYPLPHSQNQQHNSQQHNSSLHPSRRTCVTLPGRTCNPDPPRILPINPNHCPDIYDLEVPFPQRRTWPKECQLSYQLPPREEGGDGQCAYICRSWGPRTPIVRPIAPGLQCPQWFDWVPGRITRENMVE